MDWNGVVEHNKEALKRILARLFGMAGMAAGVGGTLSPGGGEGLLRRARHSAVLRLLRPAESAVRRLIVVAARGMVVKLPPPRPPKPKPMAPLLRSLGIAVVLSPADIARAAKAARAAAARAARPRLPSLPLLDPLKRFGPRRRYVPPHAAPRIWTLGMERRPLPPPPSPDDLIDAGRLGLRLQALASALDDLPAQARRFARWKARRDAALAREKDAAGAQTGGFRDSRRFYRISPLRPGRAPGNLRKPTHEVHEVLKELHYFAFETLHYPDTS